MTSTSAPVDSLSSPRKLEGNEQNKKSWVLLLWALYHLTKPTITLLVVVTTVPGLLLINSHQSLPGFGFSFVVLLATGLMSASAAVFNQTFESHIDLQMNRTQKRSIPSGKISKTGAVLYGIILGLLSSGLFLWLQLYLAWGISLFGHFFYAVFYTLYLKPRTPQNIVIGGIAGAVGPLIGAAAETGTLPLAAWMLFLIIVLWTPPHFWALALKYKDDYARANIPMHPNVYGPDATKKSMLIYGVSLFIPMFVLYFTGDMSIYGFLACVLINAQFVYRIYDLYISKDYIDKAMKVFYFSLVYTFVIFAIFTLDRII